MGRSVAEAAKKTDVRGANDKRTVVDGSYSFPAFERAKITPRARMHYEGRLALPADVKKVVEANGLVPRWVSVDEHGRFDEMVGSGVYAPLLKDGQQMSQPAGGGGRMVLMVTSKEQYDASMAAQQQRILDPLEHKKGAVIDPATGQRREIDLDVDEKAGEYAPNGEVTKEDTPLR